MFPQMYPTDAQPEEAQAATDREINGWLFQSVGSVQVNDAEGDNQSPSKQRQTAQGHQPGCEQAANYVKPAYRSCWYSCQRKMSLRGLLVEDMAAGAARHLVLAEELRSFGNPGMRTRYRVLAGPGMAPSCYFRRDRGALARGVALHGGKAKPASPPRVQRQVYTNQRRLVCRAYRHFAVFKPAVGNSTLLLP